MKEVASILFSGLLMVLLTASLAGQSGTLSETRNYLEMSDQLTTSGQIRYDHIEAIRAAGHEVVVNLAPADAERNGEEGFRVVAEGMTYVHIPVSWQNPSLEDLDLFFEVMDAASDRKVYVHCFANMRVSVFVYLYRTLRQGVSHEVAWKDVLKVWDPTEQPQWKTFIERARGKVG